MRFSNKFIGYEAEYLSKFKTLRQQRKSVQLKTTIFPQVMDEAKESNNRNIKDEYVEILKQLLEIRSGFTKKLMVDIVSTVNTVHDVEPAENRVWSYFSMKRDDGTTKRKKLVDCRRGHSK